MLGQGHPCALHYAGHTGPGKVVPCWVTNSIGPAPICRSKKEEPLVLRLVTRSTDTFACFCRIWVFDGFFIF